MSNHKIVFRDATDARFVAMNEEEQKDFFFLLLSTMDEISEKIDSEKDPNMQKLFKRDFEHYAALADFFLSDPEWMKETPYSTRDNMRAYAHKMRKAWSNRAQA